VIGIIILALIFVETIYINCAYFTKRNYFPIRTRAPYLVIFHSATFSIILFTPFIVEALLDLGFIEATFPDPPASLIFFKAIIMVCRSQTAALFVIRTNYTCLLWKWSKESQLKWQRHPLTWKYIVKPTIIVFSSQRNLVVACAFYSIIS
jgi:hypothetical protein